MKRLLLLLTGLLLLLSAEGQILRYSNATAPEEPSAGIEIVDTEVTSIELDGTSHSINMPTGLSAGDLILVFFASDGVPAISINTGVSGNNWTIEADHVSGTAASGAVIWKIAEGSDALTLTTDAAQQTKANAYGLSGVDASDPITVTEAAGNNVSPNPPSNTGLLGAVDYLWFAVAAIDSYITISAVPTDFDNLLSTNYNIGGSCSINSAYRYHNTASAYDPDVFTSSGGDEWVTFTVIVNPE